MTAAPDAGVKGLMRVTSVREVRQRVDGGIAGGLILKIQMTMKLMNKHKYPQGLGSLVLFSGDLFRLISGSGLYL